MTKTKPFLPLDLVGQFEGEHRLELFEEGRDLVVPGRRLGPGMDDDLLADPEELGLLGDDLVVELRARDLQDVLGVADGLVEVLALVFRKGLFHDLSFFFVFHGTQLSWLHHAVHDVLLPDLEDVGRQPVEDQPALELHEEDGHDDRHDEHHPACEGSADVGVIFWEMNCVAPMRRGMM